MKNPKVEKSYVYVRVLGNAIEHAEFIRSADGSALILRNAVAHIHECHPDAWRNALAELDKSGFIEVRDAMHSGMIPSDWAPTHTVAAPVVADLEPGPNNSFKPKPLRGSA